MPSSATRSETTPIALELADDPVGALRHAYALDGLVSVPTSGTTGPARRVVRTARSWVDSFGHSRRLCGLAPGSRVWVPGPVQATMNLYALALAAWSDDVVQVGSPAEATHAFLTPAVLARLLDAAPAPTAPLRAVVAGDRLEPALADRAEAVGLTVDHYYGAAQLSFVAWGRDAASLEAYPEVEIEVRDGELWVRSPWVCTAETGDAPALRWAAGGWASVGDRGRLDSAGQVEVTGRPGLIVTAGVSVSVALIEESLRALARGPVYVIGQPHPRLGQVVVAVCCDPADLDRLPPTARGSLAAAERPRRWLLNPDPPLTPAGKVDRAALLAWAAGS